MNEFEYSEELKNKLVKENERHEYVMKLIKEDKLTELLEFEKQNNYKNQ